MPPPAHALGLFTITRCSVILIYFYCLSLFVHESRITVVLSFIEPTSIAHTVAVILQYYCCYCTTTTTGDWAIYETPPLLSTSLSLVPLSLMYAIHTHTTPSPPSTIQYWQSWWHPASKNLLRLEAGYPALRCHNLEEEPLTPPQRLEKYRRDLK